MFEKRKNAEMWRKNRMMKLDAGVSELRPGDLIMRGFIQYLL
jgi:hypothetical protein